MQDPDPKCRHFVISWHFMAFWHVCQKANCIRNPPFLPFPAFPPFSPNQTFRLFSSNPARSFENPRLYEKFSTVELACPNMGLAWRLGRPAEMQNWPPDARLSLKVAHVFDRMRVFATNAIQYCIAYPSENQRSTTFVSFDKFSLHNDFAFLLLSWYTAS